MGQSDPGEQILDSRAEGGRDRGHDQRGQTDDGDSDDQNAAGAFINRRQFELAIRMADVHGVSFAAVLRGEVRGVR